MRITFRSWFVLGALGVLVSAASLLTKPVLADPDGAPTDAQLFADAAEVAQAEAGADGLTEESLGSLLQTMGLQTTKEEKRYDFVFAATYGGEEWQLSMSAVLSQDADTVWVMAWLDELPKSAADVPRSSLLRLLGENDKMGAGKFFAFVPNNRRFVLERVIANRNLTADEFRAVLVDLGQSVVDTYPLWFVGNWNAPAAPTAGAPAAGAPEAAAAPAEGPIAPEATTGASPAQSPRRLPSAVNDSKFQELRRN